MKSYFFQHNNVQFRSQNFDKIDMLGKKTSNSKASTKKSKRKNNNNNNKK